MPSDPIPELLEALRARATAERAEKEKAYLKSDLVHLGVPMPGVRAVAKDFRKTHQPGADEIVALAAELWGEGVHELRAVACVLLEGEAKKLEPRHLDAIEALLRDSATWAYVDSLAANVVGTIVDRHPEAADRLDAWSVDRNFWMRRSALLALLVPLREGRGDWDRFVRYAEPMLAEKEFFVRKAIGWVLRETAKKRPDLVRSWVEPRQSRMSGLTYREATRTLPPG
jgi:3-methyladenine DNA glycosylase AlkD